MYRAEGYAEGFVVVVDVWDCECGGTEQGATVSLVSIEAELQVYFPLEPSNVHAFLVFSLHLLPRTSSMGAGNMGPSKRGCGRPRKDGITRPASSEKTAQSKSKTSPPTKSTRTSTRLKGHPKRFEDGAPDDDAMEVDEQVQQAIPKDNNEEPPKPRVRPTAPPRSLLNRRT